MRVNQSMSRIRDLSDSRGEDLTREITWMENALQVQREWANKAQRWGGPGARASALQLLL